jgi:hypothetical protein
LKSSEITDRQNQNGMEKTSKTREKTKENEKTEAEKQRKRLP